MLDDLILYQIINIRKRFSNEGLLLYNYFYEKTEINPQCVITVNRFIFFFVKNEDFFGAIGHLGAIRKQMRERKILIIRAQDTLINLLFSFFPDLYIHDIKIERHGQTGKRHVLIGFLTDYSYMIAVGRNGDFIKAVNEIFRKYVMFSDKNYSLEIKCKVIDL